MEVTRGTYGVEEKLAGTEGDDGGALQKQRLEEKEGVTGDCRERKIVG